MDDENNGITQRDPSTDADSMPKGGGPFQRGKKASVKIKNGIKDGIGRAVNELWKRLTIKQKLIVIAIIAIIVIIILAAALLMSMISETTNVASDNVDKFIASNENLDKEAKELFDDKSSLIFLKISDINNIYKQFVADNKGGSETQTLMQYEIGSNEVKENDKEKRIANIDDKLPLYKHILMTEKYNFNSIKWQKFSHSNSTAGDLKVKFVEDKEKGLKYPDDTKFEDGSANPSPMKLEKFIDLTLPYLQSWYIPLSMSNASVVSGTEKDSNRSPQFSYNIIKEAYSNVVVNWYEIKEHTLNTKYYTYDKVKKHDTLYGLEVIKKTYGDGSVQYSYRTNHLSKVSNVDEKISYDTSTDSGLAGGNKNPMKEEYVGESDKYKSTFYLKEADMFDAKIINNFNYKVYLESDVNNRTNANSMSTSESPYAISADNINNRADAALERINVGEDGTVSIGYADYTPELVSSYVEEDPTRSTENITIYNINVRLGDYYEYENEKQHNVTRVWKDTLEQTKSETSDYTIDDLLIYNQSKDRKETVSGSDLCGENYSSSSVSGNISTGTSSPATEIHVGNYTYPVFNQGEYGQTKHGGSTIAQAGCGLCSLTTVVGGITGKKVDPISCGNDTVWTGAKTLDMIANDLKSVYGIDTVVTRWDNNSAGGSITEKERVTKQSIKEALQNNNPVIALIKPGGNFYLGTYEAHYVTIVGIENDILIIANSAGGLENRENIDNVIHNIYVGATEYECGFIVAKRNTNTSSNSSVSNSNSSSSQTIPSNNRTSYRSGF